MADYKNYIVNYNITANTAEAAEGIRRMAAEAKAAADWLKPIQQGIRQISQSAKVLANTANTRFTPTIETSTFNTQLRQMVASVNAAAEEMRAAINNALRGTDQKAGPIRSARLGATKSYADSLIGKTKSELNDELKAQKSRLRAISKSNGELAQVKRDLAKYPTSQKFLAREKALQLEEQALQERINELERAMLTAPKTKQATSTSQKPTATPASSVSKPGVIDTAFLKQYQRMFGSAKSVTLKINANATGPKGALTVIAQVADSMRALQAQSSFTISPLLNPEAFAAAEAQLRGLARLSGAVVAPFGGTTGTMSKGAKGAKAGRGTKVGKAAATPLAVDVVGKITSITPPKTELVVPVIGEMTKILNKVSEAIPVNVRISASSINESIKTMKRPVIPASIKLMWDKGAIGRQEQLKNIQNKIPPIKLTLDTAGAIVKLEEFIALVKANSPQNINLTATGTPTGSTGRTGAAGRGTGRGTTGVQPLASGTWLERATRQYKAQKYQAQLHNSLLPFGLNKSQMDVVKKYYRYFRQGAKVSGISPTVDMQPSQMKQYLQAVSGQMQASNLAVPYQLQSYMSRLDKQIAGKSVGRSAGVSVPQEEKQFYDRARKWAYPFAGNTSFGARTPMAVDMAKGMGVTYALTGAMSAIGNSFSQAMEYQNTMQTTKTILQNGTDTYSQSNFRNMEEMVREVGIKTKFSAPEVANAARFLAMAGYNIDDINNSIRPIADLALIGDLDLGETADKMTNIMTTFGIKSAMMRDAANIMATTATRSNTDLMMLAESAKYGGGMARLYGSSRENPLENFAETMAIFGMMGNAGVQGSSAGTALRMMYMNLFNPNTKQQKVHEKLLADYGVSMYQDEAKTKRRSMADIIIDMAAKIPQDKMADLVSKLFRVTATAGASSVLQAAGVEENNTQQSLAENEAIVAQLNKGNQFSQLAQLIKANVASIGGNVSGIFGEAKQNTISGLWAQVTSTFTEGVVKAFEQRQGSFEGMLKGLRDYLARPQTVEMIQKLLDMIIEVGKVLAWFIDLWAKLYSLAPDAITAWIKWQMIFTQVGSLISPAIQLVGAFNRLGGALASLLGISLTGATAVGGAVASGEAAVAATIGGTIANAATVGGAAVGGVAVRNRGSMLPMPMNLGLNDKGRMVTAKGFLAGITRKELAINSMLATTAAFNGGNFAAKKAELDRETYRRARVMAAPRRVWTDSGGQSYLLKGNAAARLTNELYNNGRNKAIEGWTTERLHSENRKSVQHAINVQERYKRMYGKGRSWRMTKAAFSNLKGMANSGAQITMGMLSLKGMGFGISNMLTGLIGGIAKAIGMLVNPATAVIAVIGGVGYGLYKLYQFASGNTESQITAQQQMAEASARATKAMYANYKWLTDEIDKWKHPETLVPERPESEEAKKLREQDEKFKSEHQDFFVDLTENASDKKTKTFIQAQRERIANNPLYRLALGNEYDNLVGNKLTKDNFTQPTTILGGGLLSSSSYNGWLYNQTKAPKNFAKDVQKKSVQAIFMEAAATDTRLPEAHLKIQQLRQEYLDNLKKGVDKSIVEQEYRSKTDEIINGIVRFKDLKDSSRMSWTEYHDKIKTVDDMIPYKGYQQGLYNILSGFINGADGTVVAKMDAYYNLKNNLVVNSDNWWQAIGQIVQDFPLTISAMTDNGMAVARGIIASMKDGQIDYQSIVKQIEDQIGSFNHNLQTFADIRAAVYIALANAGIMTLDEAKQFIKGDMEHAHIPEEEAKQYYSTLPENHPWKVAKRSASEYAKFVTDPNQTVELDGQTFISWDERRRIRETIALRAYNGVVKPAIGKVNNPNVKQFLGGGDNPNKNTPDVVNQDGYASHYDKGAARPTVVNINIGEFAHFDRTAVASSAEERDLMAAMEVKMSEAMYRLFAVAANQAQNAMNFT